VSIQIIGPPHSKSRALLQNMCEGMERDLQIVWGREMDKFAQIQKLGMAGIPIPWFTSDCEVARGKRDLGSIVWGRKFNHTQGRDIKTDPSVRGWARSDYWVEVIEDVKDEWRIHVMDGLVIHSERKHHPDGCPHGYPPTSTDWGPARVVYCEQCDRIRSRRNGWRMTRDRKPSKALMDLAKAAVKTLEWDLGAVDVIEKTDGNGVVLEVNSRPGLDNRTARQYLKGIQRRLQL
jgi:hypothetical protein